MPNLGIFIQVKKLSEEASLITMELSQESAVRTVLKNFVVVFR